MSLGLLLAGRSLHQEAIRRCRDDEDPEVRGSFAVLLGLSGAPEAVDSLIEAGWENDLGGLCATYAMAMLSTGDPASIARAMMTGKNEHTRALGIMALAATSRGEALAELRKHKADGTEENRAIACVVSRYCGQDGLSLGSRMARERSEDTSAMAMAFLGSTSCDASLKAIADLKRSIKGECAICLEIAQSNVKAQSVCGALAACSGDARPEVRSAVITARSRLEGAISTQDLLAAIKTERVPYARRYAINALACAMPVAEADMPEVFAVLGAVITGDGHPECRAMAALALGLARGNAKAAELIHKATDDSVPDVVACAAIALGMEGSKDNGRVLYEMVRKWRGTPIEEAALLGLWQWADGLSNPCWWTLPRTFGTTRLRSRQVWRSLPAADLTITPCSSACFSAERC
jgi:HEAT repeat protein